jgi:hypothetical protein
MVFHGVSRRLVVVKVVVVKVIAVKIAVNLMP